MLRFGALIATGLFVLAGCSGGEAVSRSDAPRIPPREPTLAEQETFDVGAYPDSPADVPIVIEHRVPQVLLDSEAGQGVARRVRGYRVQVASTTDAQEALQLEEDVRAYWADLVRRRTPDVSSNPGIYRFFRQPYYRIRLGNFTDRSQADRVASLLSGRFPGAFTVPDDVTVR